MPEQKVRIIVLGGQAHRSPNRCLRAEIQCFPSTRHGGNGAVRRVLARIKSGSTDAVVIRADFIGHSSSKAVRAECKRQGLEVRFVSGGRSLVVRVLTRLIATLGR